MARPRAIESRPYVAGRLRNGVMAKRKRQDGSTYTAPTAVDHWIFTSPDLSLIEPLQAAYGGVVSKWHEPKANPPDQWKLVTETNRVKVLLPPDPLETDWEHWAGSVCERRCDRSECWYRDDTGNRTLMPCVCADEEGAPTCKPKSRLTVMLPAANMAGVWRYDSNSEFFANEAPAMINQIEMLMAARRLSVVDLVLTKRTGMAMIKGKKTKTEFVVPTIQIGHTIEEILAGRTLIGPMIEQGNVMKALDKGWTEPVVYDSVFHDPINDDEVVDAEVIETPVQPPVKRDESDGWDKPPPGVAVVLNPKRNEPGEKRYVRK